MQGSVIELEITSVILLGLLFFVEEKDIQQERKSRSLDWLRQSILTLKPWAERIGQSTAYLAQMLFLDVASADLSQTGQASWRRTSRWGLKSFGSFDRSSEFAGVNPRRCKRAVWTQVAVTLPVTTCVRWGLGIWTGGTVSVVLEVE